MFIHVTPPAGKDCHCTVGDGVPLAAAVKLAALPAVTVAFDGCWVTVGAAVAGFTVSVAGFVVAVPAEFVNTARNCVPSCACVVEPMLCVRYHAPGISDHDPPTGIDCHCTVGDGFPLAAAVKLAALPAVTVELDGCPVTTGALFTVNVAAFVVADPDEFVNTARYWVPFCAPVVESIVCVGDVAPAMFDHDPPTGMDCHWTVGVGVPLAAAVKLAALPAVAVAFDGCCVTVGAAAAGFTVSVAGFVVAEPAEFVNTARNCVPFCAVVVEPMVCVRDVAPAMFDHDPPTGIDCHCTLGAGVPLAAAVKDAACPASTETSRGLSTTTGAVALEISTATADPVGP